MAGCLSAFGRDLALQHYDPNLLRGVLNFNIARAGHLNLAVLWIVSGFIGTVVWVLPLLSEREVSSPGVTRLLLYALIAVVLWNMGTLWLAQDGNAGWWGDVPLFQEGLEYIEGGRITDVLVLVGFMMFGASQKVADYAVFWGVSLVWLSGLIGPGTRPRRYRRGADACDCSPWAPGWAACGCLVASSPPGC